MPPIAKSHCKFEGCSAPRHVYPSGFKAQFCDAHLKYRQKARKGELSITACMRDVLSHLIEAKARFVPFVKLEYPLAPGKTITSLLRRGWIAEGMPGWYCVTEKGIAVLAAYNTPINRRDGICPACNERPRHKTANGRRVAYCLECERERTRQKQMFYKTVDRSDRCCPRCNKRSRHQYPGGGWSAYCQHCGTVNRRKNARKERQRQLQAIQSGAPVPICPRCQQSPVTVFPNSVSKYCRECTRIFTRRHKLRAAKQFIPLVRKVAS